MLKSRLTFNALISLLFLSNVTYAASLESYARLPYHEDVALSPDGKHIAFVTTVGDAREAIIQPLDGQENGRRLQVGDKKLRGLYWASPDHLIINASQSTGYLGGSQDEIFSAHIYDLRRDHVFNPGDFHFTHLAALTTIPGATLPASNATIFLGMRAFGGLGIARFDLDRQMMTMLDAFTGGHFRYGWQLDPDGKLLALSQYDEDAKVWKLSVLRDNKWVEVQSEQTEIDYPIAIGLGPEPDTLLFNRLEDGELVPRRFSIKDGKWGDALSAELRGSRYLLDRSRRVIGAVQIGTREKYVFFDEKLQLMWDKVVKSFPNEEVALAGRSDDWSKVIVQVFGTKTGTAYVLIDNASGQLSYLGSRYSGIEPSDISPVSAVSYSAADGKTITGYLTIPRNATTKNMPLIVMPHGGPAARDTLGFDWFAQALASRGYMVLQPNFRGSYGLGGAFQQAGYGEMGRKMQTDLSDGVRALTKLGVADPKRVCIVGSSYGGYAALTGITTESDVYRCAVSISGISDLKKQYYESLYSPVVTDNRALRSQLRYVGAKNLDDPILTERSPAFHANNVMGPLLLIHGNNDSVVSYEQSEIMANALKKAGKRYEFVKLKGEDHWLSKADTRLQMLQAVVKFLETNNPP